MPVSLDEIIKDIDNLVSLPSVGARVNKMVEDPSATAADIGKVISQDPALTARLLRVANSAFYGLSSQVNTVSRAVAVIGSKRVRDLVLATSTISAFEGIPNKLVSMENFWRHSLYCGTAAQILAEQRRIHDPETMFIAGLLHDIGQLVIFRKLPKEAKQVLMLSLEGPDDLELHKAEQQVLGFDHAQLGGALLRQWHFPESLIECAEFHHAPSQAKKYPKEAALIHIANCIATLAEIDSVTESDAPATDPAAWTTTGLFKELIEPTVRASQAKFLSVQSLFVKQEGV
jgi:putative nucleotidyltransferase with HDIG domain